MRPRMRQSQFGGVDDLPAKVNEVDVNRPGAVPDRPNPPKIVLDRMHPTGKVKRIEHRLENRDLIEELERGESRRSVDWLGLNDGTRRHKPRRGQGRKRGNRPLEIIRPRLDVGSKGDYGEDTARGGTSSTVIFLEAPR